MIRPIDLNDEARAGRQEIRDESLDGHLAAKGNSELFSGKSAPEKLF